MGEDRVFAGDLFLDQLREELVQRRYRPLRARKVETPKEGGKVRLLSIPSIEDRVAQGALKLSLEPIFEADFQGGSFGYRPKKSAHAACEVAGTGNGATDAAKRARRGTPDTAKLTSSRATAPVLDPTDGAFR